MVRPFTQEERRASIAREKVNMGKIKELRQQMQDSEPTEIGMYWTSEGKVILDTDGRQLHMTRPEAEQLFVDLGHCLQDMDVTHYSNENGEEKEQP